MWERAGFELVAKPCAVRRPGYPLDSLSVLPTGEYVAEQWEAGLTGDRSGEVEEAVKFVLNIWRENCDNVVGFTTC